MQEAINTSVASFSLLIADGAVLAALFSCVLSLFGDARPRMMQYGAFFLLGISGLAALIAGLLPLIGSTVSTQSVLLGLPWLHWHLRLDPLSGWFLIMIGAVTLAVAVYGPAYVREFIHGPYSLAVLGSFTGLFIAGMQLVVLADDAFAFLVAWELMSVSSYFLVAYQHQHAANRRAAFLYLLMAHLGAVAILLAFGILAHAGGDFTFSALRAAAISDNWATLAFALALFGFGIKAGLVPGHMWLPEAHPAAPSHISALMSGVMLKIAVYGFIRVVFDLIGEIHWQWGVTVLLIGSVTALFGVLYAMMQSDLKRLLAYSSIENIGIIFLGLGLAMIFFATGHLIPGVIALSAALFHCLNHAMFKSLLFLGAGAIVHAAHETDLEHMGGLIRRMPHTAALFLVGCLSIAALPPFNGFASEWLTFQAALQTPTIDSGVLRIVIPVAAAMLALTAALGAGAFVKVYGIAFLGRGRSRHISHAREVGWGMRGAQAWLAVLCLLLGLLSPLAIDTLQPISQMLVGIALPAQSGGSWLVLAPVSATTAAYAAPFIIAVLLLAVLGTRVFMRLHGNMIAPRRAAPWDCGFGPLTTRMQYTAHSFAMPLRRIFRPVWRLEETVEETPPAGAAHKTTAIHYLLHVHDRFWNWVYEPVYRTLQRSTRIVTLLQSGNVRNYLTYSFVTLLILLWVIS
jgi:hydrogenase-4 component B